MSEIQAGDRVIIRTADNHELLRRATSRVINGGDFPVVWITSEEEWEQSQSEGRAADSRPWPCEDVRLATTSEEPAA